jgi:hypothetical protein
VTAEASVDGADRKSIGPVKRLVIDTAIGTHAVPITVHVLPVELLTGIDVVVSSENVYLQMSKTFRQTVSGSLRRAVSSRGSAGEIIDDVLAKELAEWLGKHGQMGLSVQPGTVVAT